MHSHDLDTIAALADGSLAHAERDAAQRLLDECSECRAEFDAQQMILGVLAETEPARLSEFERARLHQQVAKLAPQPKPRGAWMAWVPRVAVAALAMAFVGTFGVVLFGNDTRTADAPLAESADTTAADGDEAISNLAVPQGVPETEAPAEESETAPDTDADDLELADEVMTKFVELGDLAEYDGVELASYRLSPDAVELTEIDAARFECLEEAREREPVLLVAGLAEFREDAVEFFDGLDAGQFVLSAIDCGEIPFP